MDLEHLLSDNKLLLTEAAIIEAIHHSNPDLLHPTLLNALMIYDPQGKKTLISLYHGFIRIAAKAGVPIILTTPTWRANRERLEKAEESRDVNSDAMGFLTDLREAGPHGKEMLALGGILGCKNDCYRPDLSLDRDDARQFHSWQALKLSRAGADFLMGATLPALDEALGMARAMAETGTPYIISFVLNRQGRLLDGNTLSQAMDTIDSGGFPSPLGYMINCAHPSFFHAGQEPRQALSRLVGFQANASSLDHSELDNAPELQSDDITDWGEQMITLNREYGVKILGGCCGTRLAHLSYIVDHI